MLRGRCNIGGNSEKDLFPGITGEMSYIDDRCSNNGMPYHLNREPNMISIANWVLVEYYRQPKMPNRVL